MAYINTAAGQEAVLQLFNLGVADAFDEVAANVVTVPFMQDITVNNSTGTFRFKTLASGSESVVTTPATNQLSLNAIVDDAVFFGDGAVNGGLVINGVLGTSKNKTKVGFRAYFDGTDAGSRYMQGVGFISGLAPTVNPDSPLWITPVSVEVDGDFTSALVPA
tara:strand:+ start:311 stop:799 length:489 start_codon:yes stop_codon:yes gene_type:complete